LQWFVNMKTLAAPAIQAVKDGTVRFYPEHWSKTYLHWMENIQDWCISRQLWWGHRFPVWYCECGEVIVSRIDPVECPKCRSKNIRQEEDVLDTWFSSWLWPFSTFGWPAAEQSKLRGVPEAKLAADLGYFYPTHFLSTASEIIFLWVARMAMAGLEFMGKAPFADVMIHGTVRDIKGVKMSKSLGNGIDPVDVIKQYGTDALRASLVLAAPEGQDPHMAMNAFESGRNFANKIWNASRFAMMSLGDAAVSNALPHHDELNAADRWILSRLQRAAAATNQSLAELKTNQALKGLYDFFWHDVCDWYLELSKVTLTLGNDEEKHKTRSVLAHVLKSSLKLLHPFMPFVTEAIWAKLTENAEGDIIVAAYPAADPAYVDDRVENELALLQEIVTIIRNIRGEMNIPPTRTIDCIIKGRGPDPDPVAGQAPFIKSLARVEAITFSADAEKPAQSASGVAQGYEIYVPLAGLIDVAKEQDRLAKEIAALTKSIGNITAKLASGDFTAKAPPQVIAKENERLAEYRDRLAKFQAQLKSLQ
ncbi:MAG: class I tRNA ligase family protein, partial [Candidatus Edwardsbacteria bacterium]|nr:class I tRNA ligase family protein [Candidatus Edwardsbacteria bacterium]